MVLAMCSPMNSRARSLALCASRSSIRLLITALTPTMARKPVRKRASSASRNRLVSERWITAGSGRATVVEETEFAEDGLTFQAGNKFRELACQRLIFREVELNQQQGLQGGRACIKIQRLDMGR